MARRGPSSGWGAFCSHTPSPPVERVAEPTHVHLAATPLPSIMALARPLPPLWQMLLPGLNGPVRPVVNLPLLQRIAHPFQTLPTPFAALALPSLSFPAIPSLGDIWEGILKAVPKKKTSYRKKRQRFMAGKGLKDVTSLNKCSACGRPKRAHFLCPYCVDGR
jgi:large subunit ribosomal protein L32